MSAISTISFDSLVQMHNQEVTTTSKIVADNFEKQHKDVLRKIDEIISDTPVDFSEINFKPIQISTNLGLNRTRKDRAYEITKDGFMLLVMGFTGKKAMEIKIKFIRAFNWAFEQILRTDSQQREILVKACSKLAIGNMLISDVYLMVGKQFGYEGGIKDIPTPLLPEATAFVYEMILRLQKNETPLDDYTRCNLKALVAHSFLLKAWYDGIKQPLKLLNYKIYSDSNEHFASLSIMAKSFNNQFEFGVDERLLIPLKYA